MKIDGNTKTAGLLGYPVKHTKSPLIHNTLAGAEGNNFVYLPFEVKPEDLEEAVKGAFALGIVGLNATVPHKEAVMQYLEGVEETARAIGAVNTLVRGKEGYIGYNTDIEGLYMALKREDIPIKGRKTLVLGAGGAARAVCFLCVREGAEELVIANRSLEKAEKIRRDLEAYIRTRTEADKSNASDQKESADGTTDRKDIGCRIRVVQLSELSEALQDQEDGYLAFQCSSVGLSPNEDACILSGDNESVFERIHTGVDLIYKPAETLFMKKLHQQGKKAINGLDMLLYQGVIAYELWRGGSMEEIRTDQNLLQEIRNRLQEEI